MSKQPPAPTAVVCLPPDDYRRLWLLAPIGWQVQAGGKVAVILSADRPENVRDWLNLNGCTVAE